MNSIEAHMANIIKKECSKIDIRFKDCVLDYSEKFMKTYMLVRIKVIENKQIREVEFKTKYVSDIREKAVEAITLQTNISNKTQNTIPSLSMAMSSLLK